MTAKTRVGTTVPATVEKPRFSLSLLSPRHWPMWIGFGLLRITVWLPQNVRLSIGRQLGKLVRRLMKSRERVARRNLELCFPDWSNDTRNQVLDDHFGSVGNLLMEAGLAWWGTPAQHKSLYRIEGLQHIESAQAAGQGVVLLFFHFTTLELAGRLLAYHIDMAALYREHSHPVLEYLARKNRLAYGEAMFNRNELRGMVKYLRRGGVLWYAPDQDYERGMSVFVPWFGIPASTITSTHQLAKMGRAKVLTTRNVRQPDGSYVLSIENPVPDLPTDDLVADTAAVNQVVEAQVCDNPAQYLWLHRRFKNRPEGESSLYD